LNIVDGLFEIGSNQIYSEKNKTTRQSKILKRKRYTSRRVDNTWSIFGIFS
jgi:hypothetical protein